MAPPLRVPLDAAEQAKLERRYHTTRDAPIRTRYQIVLLVRCSADTVCRVLKRYLAGGRFRRGR